MAVPPLLEKVGDSSFYRTKNGRLQYFGTDSAYHNVERADGVLLLSDIKRSSDRIAGNASASLWDIGDKVLCLEFHSKMNSVDEGIMKRPRVCATDGSVRAISDTWTKTDTFSWSTA